MRLLSLLLLLTLFVLPEAESRTRRNSNTVRKERSATERKIKETRRQINANLDDTRRELNRLTGLEGEMRRQDKDIRAMQRRVDSLRAAAKMIADSVAEANTRVEKLRASRADALRALRRQRQTANSATAFIFSSEISRRHTDARATSTSYSKAGQFGCAYWLRLPVYSKAARRGSTPPKRASECRSTPCAPPVADSTKTHARQRCL